MQFNSNEFLYPFMKIGLPGLGLSLLKTVFEKNTEKYVGSVISDSFESRPFGFRCFRFYLQISPIYSHSTRYTAHIRA